MSPPCRFHAHLGTQLATQTRKPSTTLVLPIPMECTRGQGLLIYACTYHVQTRSSLDGCSGVGRCAAETRAIGRSLFLTFAGTFREEVGGILKNVDPATALKLQRSLRDSETSAPASQGASARGPFGGLSSGAPSSRGVSRPGAARASRVQTPPTDPYAGQRSRPPSHSPGIKSRYSSAPGMHSDSRHGTPSMPVRLETSPCPPCVHRCPHTCVRCLCVLPEAHFPAVYLQGSGAAFSAALTWWCSCVVFTQTVFFSKRYGSLRKHGILRADSDGQPLSIGAALSQYAAAKSPTGPLSWSIAVALFEAISHAVEHAASTSGDGAALLRPHMMQYVPATSPPASAVCAWTPRDSFRSSVGL